MARGGFTLVTQKDGAVLAIGGTENSGDSRPSAYVDVYRDGAWTRGPDLPTPRKSATVLGLRDGGALVLFGFALKGVVAGGERLDAKLGAWTAISSPFSGTDLGAVQLPDGRVLVASGHDKQTECMADTAIFDPMKNAWSKGPRLPEPQVYGAPFAAAGKVFLIGGLCDNDYYPVRVFDPASATWSSGAPGPVERIGNQKVQLLDGRILVSGGEPSKLAKDPQAAARLALFDPKTNEWRSGPALRGPRQSHGVAVMPDGRVMLAGGESESFHEIDTVEIYDPKTDTVSAAAPLPRAVLHPSLVALPNGNVLAVGGWVNTPGKYLGDAWLWSP